jgi:histidine ammonia-lyase
MVVLSGEHLTIAELIAIARKREKIRVASSQWHAIRKAHRFVMKHARDSKPLYGINTGFGALAQVRIAPKDLKTLQHNIILSHTAGVGDALPLEVVRCALAIRINTLVRGFSGVSEQLIKTLVALLNNDIIPLVPHKGSVGASGDLAPLAAMSLVVLGKGEVVRNGTRMSAARALRQAKIRPLVLGPKEGLALINGTHVSTAIAAFVSYIGARVCDQADRAGALSLDALRGSVTPFSPYIVRLRPHRGSYVSARNIRHAIRGSRILRAHRMCPVVQDAYSLRCMAHVHGAVRDIFSDAERAVATEINAVTDNPLVLPDKNAIVSGGNFHAEPIAFCLDFMAIGLAELASISERRTFRLLDSRLSGLNAFLAKEPGLHSGFMLAQTTAAALVSHSKTLCHPASVDSIPTSADQEDHVSMSMNAGIKALEVLENTKYVLAIEMLCACQALDLLKPLRSSPYLEKVRHKVRKYAPFVTEDRPLTPLIEKVKTFIDAEAIA